MPDLFSLNENPKSLTQGKLMTAGTLVETYKTYKLRTGKLEDGTEVWVVVDIIRAVTESKNPTDYWYRIKKRMKEEGNEISTNCRQLKIQASDGKFYAMEVMTREQVFRMLQSIPSKKAEPFKQWLAKLANERLEEIENPDVAIQRGYEGYIRKGKSPKWAKARVETILQRNKLTDQWQAHGINRQKDFARLTDREYQGTFGQTTKELKTEKRLPATANLRDHMSRLELLAQHATEEAISILIDEKNPQGYEENAREVDRGSVVGANVLVQMKGLLAD